MKQLTLYASASFDPRTNLALEEALFQSMPPASRILLLYRNSPSIIIGRNQNPWLECSLPLLNRRAIPFYRRFSGGGTVYHDPGNLNYSFMTPRQEFDRSTAALTITKTLRKLDIPAELSPRNDILADNRKVSGSAYRITGDKAYHHGTLLVSADLKSLGSLLKSRLEIIDSRSTQSVSSPVVNLDSINPDLTVERVTEAVAAGFSGSAAPSLTILDSKNCPRPEVYRETYDRLGTAAWQLEKTPRFSFSVHLAPENRQSRFADDHVRIEVDKGRIVEIACVGSTSSPNSRTYAWIGEILKNCLFSPHAVKKAVKEKEPLDAAAGELAAVLYTTLFL